MKLQQKHFPFGTVTFDLSEKALVVESKRLLNSRTFEVPLCEISGSTSKIQQFPIVWCLFASLASLVFMASIVGTILKEGDAAIGFGALALCSGVFAALSWFGFAERKLDFVILHSRSSGQPVVYFKRTSPSIRHVEEFVEIVKERAETSTL